MTANAVGNAAPSALGGPATEERTALAEAARTGERVEVVGARTELTTTYANPDGASLRLEQSAVPVRVRGGAGGWVKPDATLEVRPDGTVAPKAAAVDVRFSGGGDGAALATVARGQKSLTMAWPGRLPKPTLDGDTAVYTDVLPGVDLRMTASTDGFRDVLVVKTPRAAANPALKRIDFGFASKGLKLRPTAKGGVAALDENGLKIFAVPPAAMWDSRGGAPATSTPPPTVGRAPASTAETRLRAPRPGDRHAGLPIVLGKERLTIVPDAALLGDKDSSAFPIYIDPQVTWGEAERTQLRSDGYESYGWGNGDDNRGQGVGECGSWNGYYCGPGYVQRLYFEFSPSALAGKHVLDATFRVTEPWAFQCDPRVVSLVRTNDISTATTWTSRPAELDWMVERSVSAGRGSLCAPNQPDAPIDFNDDPTKSFENLTPTVRDFAAGKFARLTLELRAKTETDTSAWKRFRNDAVLVVDYVGKPYYPSSQGIVAGSGTTCSPDAAKPTIVSDPTPQLAATVRTYSGGESGAMLKALFRVEKQSGTSWVAAQSDFVSPTGTGYLASGGRTTPSVTTTLAEGTSYRMSSWTRSYWNNFSSWLVSTSAGYCYFKVDPTAPKAPTVTVGTPYSLCATTCLPGGSPGVSAPFTFTPASGDTITGYQYRRSGQAAWSQTAAGSTVKQPIVPPEPGTYQLEVRAKDGLGRYGASQIVSILVNEGSGPVGRWRFDEDSGDALDTSTTVAANQDNATLFGGAVRSDQGRRGEVWYDAVGNPLTAPRADRGLQLNGSTSYAATAGPALESRASYTVSAWVRVSKAPTRTMTVLGQATTTSPWVDKYSPFILSYGANGKDGWSFRTLSTTSVNGGLTQEIRQTTPTAKGVWTHVAAVHDTVAHKATLYVNGRTQGTIDTGLAWNADGALQIGRLLYGNTFVDYFDGSIDEVAVWQRVLTPEEIATEARTVNARTDRPEAELVAAWNAAGVTGTSPLIDGTSGYGPALTLEGGAAADGQALVFDGKDDGATAPGPLTDDTGSFTVTAKVELDRAKLLDAPLGSISQVVGQRAADGSSWGLWFELRSLSTELDDEGKEKVSPIGFWHFGRVDKDGTKNWVESDDVADVGNAVQLTGVVKADGATGQTFELYVGSSPQDRESTYPTLVGSGEFAVGKGLSATDWGHFLPGRVSDVRLWAGAMKDDAQVKDIVIGE
ncbi:LamG domain-containing protein [Streptomyces sp. NPDC094032]|uniref:LamG domain-containing protein n=1 Tax=Streptomyces sp. NPDC094032 TaxID=3155308 RepID=UPI00332D4D5B